MHRSHPSSPRNALLQILLLKFTKCSLQLLSTVQFILFFLLFLRYLLLGVFTYQEKSLLLLRFLPHLRTFRGPSWLLLFLSLDSCQICYFCYFCYICYSIFSHSKKSSSYFCDICYFFYTFLIAVFFIFFAKIVKTICQPIFANKIDTGHKCCNVTSHFSSL